MSDNQGGGCGDQAAADGGDVKLRLQIMGNFGISAGLPIPLFNGVNDAPAGDSKDCRSTNGKNSTSFRGNDAPTGVSEDWPMPELSSVCGRKVFMPLNEGVVAAAVADEPGLSNCLNRSMFICCAMVTTGDGDGEPNNFDHLLFLFCPANV